ncbi:MAG: sigma-70 family RNA polymerase sigma factor [Cyclobacteriaceae bacterium]
MVYNKMDNGSVTHFLEQLKNGDDEGLNRLWSTYFEKLVVVAQKYMIGRTSGITDGEDIALSVMTSLYDRARRERINDVNNRQMLWRMLVVVTKQKCIDKMRQEGRQKRGGGRILRESDLQLESLVSIEDLAVVSPSTEFVCSLSEELNSLLLNLKSERLREIAILKLEGLTNSEISQQLGVSVSTIERKIARIRVEWSSGLRGYQK